MSTPIKPAPGTGPLPPSPRVQAKIADHLAARAQAWAESRFGSMSMSAAVNVALAEAMPFLERQARLGRDLSSMPDAHMDAGGHVLETAPQMARMKPKRRGLLTPREDAESDS